MLQQLRIATFILLAMTILTGGIYPLVVTAITQVVFSRQANGSLLYQDGKIIGSDLIGQSFSEPQYFWGRLSATVPVPYNAAASGGSNFGPLHPGLKEATQARMARLGNEKTLGVKVPVDLVTASASGLDPHITPASAEFQVSRIATSRKMSEDKVRELIHQHTAGRQLGVLGEPRVNVLQLNLALDQQPQN